MKEAGIKQQYLFATCTVVVCSIFTNLSLLQIYRNNKAIHGSYHGNVELQSIANRFPPWKSIKLLMVGLLTYENWPCMYYCAGAENVCFRKLE